MGEIVIRPAQAGDIDEITGIYAEAVINGTASYELEPPSIPEMATRFDGIVSGGYPFLAAEQGGGVVGYAYAGAFRARPAYRFIVEDSIYIAPGARGAGIGRQLLSALVTEVERAGFRQIIAVIGDGRSDSPSVRLHERAGFRYAGCLQGSGYKFGRWLDTVFMQLALNGGSESAPSPDSLPERIFRSRPA